MVHYDCKRCPFQTERRDNMTKHLSTCSPAVAAGDTVADTQTQGRNQRAGAQGAGGNQAEAGQQAPVARPLRSFGSKGELDLVMQHDGMCLVKRILKAMPADLPTTYFQSVHCNPALPACGSVVVRNTNKAMVTVYFCHRGGEKRVDVLPKDKVLELIYQGCVSQTREMISQVLQAEDEVTKAVLAAVRSDLADTFRALDRGYNPNKKGVPRVLEGWPWTQAYEQFAEKSKARIWSLLLNEPKRYRTTKLASVDRLA